MTTKPERTKTMKKIIDILLTIAVIAGIIIGGGLCLKATQPISDCESSGGMPTLDRGTGSFHCLTYQELKDNCIVVNEGKSFLCK